MVKVPGVRLNDIVQENVFDRAFGRWYAEDSRQGARHSYHSEKHLRTLSLPLQEESHAEGLVQNTRERMGRVYRDWRYQRLHAVEVESCHRAPRFRSKLPKIFHTYGLLGKGGQQLFAPAIVLGFHKFVNRVGKPNQHFAWRQTVGPGISFSVFGLPQETSNANLHKLIEITGRNSEELDPF